MWKTVDFEDCLQKVKVTSKLQRKDYKQQGKFPVVSQEAGLVNGYCDSAKLLFTVQKPIILFGDHTQVVKYIDFDFVMGADGAKVLLPREDIDTRFLFYQLQLRMPKSAGYARHYKLLKNLKIVLPPLAEQQRIVEKLDRAFVEIDKIASAKKKTAENIKAFSKSVIESALRSFDNLEHTYTLSELIQLGWIEGHLDGNHGSDYPKKEEFVKSGVPYISANCIEDGNVSYKKVKYLSNERALGLRKGIAKNGDVLFAHNATVGPTAILKTDFEKVILGTSLTYYRCAPSKIFNEYLLAFMNSRLFVSQYEAVMRQATRSQVPITKQREFRFVIPPYEKQIEISERIGRAKEYVDLIAKHTYEIFLLSDTLKISILKQALQPQKQ